MLNGLSDAVEQIANETQQAIGTFGEPNINILGINIPGKPVISTTDYFLVQMESWFTAIPRNTHWVVLIERFPPALTTGMIKKLENVDASDTSWDTTFAVKAIKSFPFQRVNGCLFAQECSLPNESYSINDVSIGDGDSGGFLQGVVNSTRSGYGSMPLSIGFRETNTSMVDMLIRPWVILAGHHGRIARPTDAEPVAPTKSFLGIFNWGGKKAKFAEENFKTNITIMQYTGSYQGISMIPRKVWTFYDCMPVSLTEQELAYDKEEMQTVRTTWNYSHYQVKDNLYLPLPDIINKMRRGLKMPKISPFQR